MVNLVHPSAGLGTSGQFSASMGTSSTPNASAALSTTWKKWDAAFTGSLFRTDGYVPVPPEARGAVDSLLNSRNVSSWIEVGRRFGESEHEGRIFMSGELYGEDRQNGTRLQTNGATIRTLTLGVERSGAAGSFSVRAWGGTENLRQTFSAVSQNRNSETLTRDQNVPVAQAGAIGVWSRTFGRRHNIAAGVETRWVRGESAEWAFAQQQITQQLRNGGEQRREAVFAEDRIRLADKLLLTAALRLDHWSNYDGFSLTRTLSTGSTARSDLRDRSETAASPKLALNWAATPRLTFFASGARSFREPTLNELYRSFRVGNVVTQANSDLLAEHATSVEGGAEFQVSSRLSFAGVYWWTNVARPVANVTQSTTPSLIVRMRENLGRLNSQGISLRGDWQFNQRFNVRAAYQFAHAVVSEFSANPSIIGNWIPQVPRHTATVQLFARPAKRTEFSLDASWRGRQFDDDANQFPLAGYPWLGAQLSHDFGEHMQAFVAAENLLNRRYEVARTPTLTVGPPVIAMIGLRWQLAQSQPRK
jgi:outer membrane receptor protein involved in Fe transport